MPVRTGGAGLPARPPDRPTHLEIQKSIFSKENHAPARNDKLPWMTQKSKKSIFGGKHPCEKRQVALEVLEIQKVYFGRKKRPCEERQAVVKGLEIQKSISAGKKHPCEERQVAVDSSEILKVDFWGLYCPFKRIMGPAPASHIDPKWLPSASRVSIRQRCVMIAVADLTKKP